jgi:hypothetical protein
MLQRQLHRKNAASIDLALYLDGDKVPPQTSGVFPCPDLAGLLPIEFSWIG